MEKYGRSLHAPISLGTTSDDRFMPEGYLQYFIDLKKKTLTEKLDGQNNCLKTNGVFARSHAAPSKLPWDRPLIERWKLLKNDLGDIEIFGESMFATHSIAYSKLESYFYVFAVRCKDMWLSWEEVKFWAEMFDFPTVPEIPIGFSMRTIRNNNLNANEDKILIEWLKANLGMTWEESVNTSGLLGGYQPGEIITPASEGFVIRNSSEFACQEHVIDVASNEFSNLFKLVRESHVKTDQHWTKHWKEASLIDCEKYKWYGYEYLMEK